MAVTDTIVAFVKGKNSLVKHCGVVAGKVRRTASDANADFGINTFRVLASHTCRSWASGLPRHISPFGADDFERQQRGHGKAAPTAIINF